MKKLIPALIQSQRDSQWGSIILGYNSSSIYNIYNYGCLITSFGNYIGKTPNTINDILKENNGFSDNSGDFIWSKCTALGLNQSYESERFEDAVTDTALDKMRSLIDNQLPLICEIDFYPSTENEESHYVLVIGYDDNDVFYAIDPWTGTEINLEVYGGVKRALYKFRAYDLKLAFESSNTTTESDTNSTSTMDEKTKRNASYFDRIFYGVGGFDWNTSSTDDIPELSVTNFIAWINDNVKRAGLYDLSQQESGQTETEPVSNEELEKLISELKAELATTKLSLETCNKSLKDQKKNLLKTILDKIKNEWSNLT